MAEEQKIGKDHIRCKTIIEVLGKPKEYVEKAIEEYVEHIKKDTQLVVLKEEFSEAAEQGEMFSKFVELDLVVKGLNKVISFCFQYMPSSFEIIKPEHFELSNVELSGFVNDLQARLHGVDAVVKQQKGENDFLKHNMNTIINNAITISLRFGDLDIDQVSKITGIHKPELEPFLEKLIKQNKIKKEGELYSLA